MSSQEKASTNMPTSKPASNASLAMQPPWSVKVIAAVMFLMSLGALFAVIWYATSMGAPGPVPMGGRIFFLLLLVAAMVLALMSGLKILQCRPWTRAFIVVWHIFQIIIATQLLIGPTWWIALLLLIPSAVAVLLMFAKPTTAFFTANLGAAPQR